MRSLNGVDLEASGGGGGGPCTGGGASANSDSSARSSDGADAGSGDCGGGGSGCAGAGSGRSDDTGVVDRGIDAIFEGASHSDVGDYLQVRELLPGWCAAHFVASLSVLCHVSCMFRVGGALVAQAGQTRWISDIIC
jgi:hypothetical protein